MSLLKIPMTGGTHLSQFHGAQKMKNQKPAATPTDHYGRALEVLSFGVNDSKTGKSETHIIKANIGHDLVATITLSDIRRDGKAITFKPDVILEKKRGAKLRAI